MAQTATLMILLCGCSGPLFKMQLPPGMENTFRSGKMKHPLFGKTSVLEYKVIQDSVIFSSYGDTTVAFGLVFPRTKMAGSKTSMKRTYGNDSLRSLLFYDTHEIYASSDSRSLLTDIILPADRNAPGYQEGSKTITSYYKYFKGYALTGSTSDTSFFLFEQTRPEKTLDTALITGFITWHRDSFVLHPYYYPIPQNKKGTYIFMLEGYGLYRKNQLYAFLQHAPLAEPGKDVIQLYNQATGEEQLLLSAYLTLVYDRLRYPY